MNDDDDDDNDGNNNNNKGEQNTLSLCWDNDNDCVDAKRRHLHTYQESIQEHHQLSKL